MLKKISFLNILLFLFFAVAAQENKTEPAPAAKTDSTVIKAIPLANLSEALNNAQIELKFIEDQLIALPALENFDSIYEIGKNRIESDKQLLSLNEKQFGQREISDALKIWKNYSARITKWLDLTSSNLTSLENFFQESDNMLKKWTLTSEQLRKEDINYALRTTISNVINQIGTVQKEIKQKQNDILNKQNKLNNLLFDVNDVIFSLQNIEKQIKTEYFVRTSSFIWKLNDSRKESISLTTSFSNSITRHQRNFKIFYLAYQQRFDLHILVLILLLIGFYYLNKNFQLSTEENNVLYVTSKLVVSKYVL
ncbi:MAG TPA: hypothetical protein VIN10_15600, partial [Bacteroidales bacterium]